MLIEEEPKKKTLLGGVADRAKGAVDSITGMAGIGDFQDLTKKFFPSEGDPSSGIVETVSETAAKFLNVGEQAVLFVTDNLGLPSIRDLVDQMQRELDASDLVCDAVGGQSMRIWAPGPDPEICISPKQIAWGLNPQNLMKSFQIGMSCGIEENVTEPIKYNLTAIDILREGDFEKGVGWLTGALAGQGLPDIINPAKLFTAPASFAACYQAKVAKEMGDLSQSDLDTLANEIETFTQGETSLGRDLPKTLGM